MSGRKGIWVRSKPWVAFVLATLSTYFILAGPLNSPDPTAIGYPESGHLLFWRMLRRGLSILCFSIAVLIVQRSKRSNSEVSSLLKAPDSFGDGQDRSEGFSILNFIGALFVIAGIVILELAALVLVGMFRYHWKKF
jgi:hypothetical protein